MNIAIAYDPVSFLVWLDRAKPGAWCEYHLGTTVAADEGRLTIAETAWREHERKRVELCQKRIAPGLCSYRAQKRAEKLKKK